MMSFRSIGSVLVALAVTTPALAVDHPVVGLKLIVVDKVADSGRAKVVFVAKDGAVSKGTATDLTQIEATLYIAYDTAFGRFDMAPGAGWLVNKEKMAKYLNTIPPSDEGGGTVKKSIIKSQKLVSVVANSLGDTPLDISAAPSGPVFVVHSVTNGQETHRHCTQFNACVHKAIAGGTGSMLVCKGNSTGDSACTAVPCGLVDMGFTVLDTCTHLEWEKKDGADAAPGSGSPNAANPHDVDNRYVWAGRCTNNTSFPCQPNAAAAATCTAATGGGLVCNECAAGNGACNVDPLGGGSITTVWDWVNQLNAASFAGHTDWRLATSAGAGLFPTGQPAELESIVDETQGTCGGGSGACIDPVFGPTAFGGYWTASPVGSLNDLNPQIYGVFSSSGVFSVTTNAAHHVRAVRTVE
jgi:hypothetical protein